MRLVYVNSSTYQEMTTHLYKVRKPNYLSLMKDISYQAFIIILGKKFIILYLLTYSILTYLDL